MQSQNKEDCLQKVREMIAEAYVAPKDRDMWEGIGERGKQIRKSEKKKRGEKKESRRQSSSWDD